MINNDVITEWAECSRVSDLFPLAYPDLPIGRPGWETVIRYRTLGRSGIDSIRIIHRALDAGINLIHTADVVLATKFSNPMAFVMRIPA